MHSSESPLVAGAAILDLVNTVSWRGDPERRDDHLRSGEDCLDWALRAGVITPEERRRSAASVALREDLVAFREVVEAVLADLDAPLLPVARAAIVDAYAHAELVGSGSRRQWLIGAPDAHLIRHRLALQLAWLLTTDPGRIGECGDQDCRWVFLDTSRGRTRRWCRSEDCGNRHRVREHQRRRSGGG